MEESHLGNVLMIPGLILLVVSLSPFPVIFLCKKIGLPLRGRAEQDATLLAERGEAVRPQLVRDGRLSAALQVLAERNKVQELRYAIRGSLPHSDIAKLATRDLMEFS